MKQTSGFPKNAVFFSPIRLRSEGYAISCDGRTPCNLRGTLPKRRRLAVLHWAVLICFAGFAVGMPYYRAADTGARRPGAMTKGCLKGSCCTSKCFLDKSGVHHCVHESGDSCDCDLSSDDAGALQDHSFQRDLAMPEIDGISSCFTLNCNSVGPPDILPDPFLSVQKPPPRAI
jgi:hypothetical protein